MPNSLQYLFLRRPRTRPARPGHAGAIWLAIACLVPLSLVAQARASGPVQLQPFLQDMRADQTVQITPHASDNRYLHSLKLALARYQAIAAKGGWGTVPGGEVLKLGSNGPHVAALRSRLIATGELQTASSRPELFDPELEQAVIRYQRNNGLEADGVVGPASLAAMNRPVEWRIRQIRLNIERWNGLPDYLGDRYVLVNIAGFALEMVAHEQVELEMRVIVGRDYRQTPLFSDRIRYIEFNPFWNVPASIANRDLVPKFAADPSQSVAQGFTAWRGTDQVDVASIDWASYGASRLPFSLRQMPGPDNALGEMKFMFPNEHAVYLHDTPAKELFSRTVRTFSSGCIRVERPMELATHLLRDEATWTAARIIRVLDSRATVQAVLNVPVPVHLVYMTAWMDRDGTVQFRPDIYGRDEELARMVFGR